jgi:hypothetical protein
MVALPASGRVKSVIMRSVVDFPAPLGPFVQLAYSTFRVADVVATFVTARTRPLIQAATGFSPIAIAGREGRLSLPGPGRPHHQEYLR